MNNQFYTATFEDNGQDFLEWIIKDGVVIDCQPFQSWLWVGREVSTENGQVILSPQRRMTVASDIHGTSPIKHRVTAIRPTNSEYVRGYMNAVEGKPKDKRGCENYRFGWNVATRQSTRSQVGMGELIQDINAQLQGVVHD